MKKRKMTHDKVSALGGIATLRKHGKRHFANAANARWEKWRRDNPDKALMIKRRNAR